MQPIREEAIGRSGGGNGEPPRFSGDFVWKFVGAFFTSAVLWTGRVGDWLKYGATLVTILFFTPVLSGDYRRVWMTAPGVALVYLALLAVILGQSAARKVSEPDSFFYSSFGEYIFRRKQFMERKKWEYERKSHRLIQQEKDRRENNSQLKKAVRQNKELEEKVEQAERDLEHAIHLASQLRGEVRLYEVFLQHSNPVDINLLMERLLKELVSSCTAVACYRREGTGLALAGAAGARFVPFFSVDEDSDCPEVESWTSGADMVSQNVSYPYEYMVSTVFPEELFVLIFRLNTTDLDQAVATLYDMMMESKHLLLITSRILNTPRPQFSGIDGGVERRWDF